MLKIKEILYKTILNEGEEYNDRYVFKGDLEELTNYGFVRLKENEEIEELKHKVGKEEDIYYKKSGLGCFLVFEEDNHIVFYSGVPIWWIGDENETNYDKDLENLIKADLVEKIGVKVNEDNI